MLPFGKKIKVMNFFVLKYTKALKGGELKRLRNAEGIPADVQKHLQRGGLPYIKVMTLSENWSVEFICSSTMYNFIDSRCQVNEQNELPNDTILALHNLFALMYADTAVLGDTEYYEIKGKALNEFMARQKASDETAESKAEDDKVLEEVKAGEEAKANIIDMSNQIKEGGNNGE